MKVALGSDHRGFKTKEEVKEFLKSRKIDFLDQGTFNQESCDYPDFGKKAVRLVADGNADFAILMCGSGIGMSIVANKFKGIRGALCINSKMAALAREHNNANVLIIAANFTTQDVLKEILESWFVSKFQGGRHGQRIAKIAELE
ncbi:MAG TPA: ribose 5-phosphate isomerase B [Candidatus Omnitrophica bacterium]|nr:ribose 5-phosphate isomerase B [Candidatus Omnitrophota bacterium]